MRHLLAVLCLVSTPVLAAEAASAPQVDEVSGKGAFVLTSTLTAELGAAGAARLASIYPPGEPIRWDVVVPERYDPANPAGLLVYISPTPSGRLPDRWEQVLEASNLIWVSANDAGNMTHVQRRALFAVISPTVIGSRYALNRKRIYVSGLSGGGKMASMVATDHAQLFTGAIFICGVEFWDSEPRRFDRILENRYVFLTGEFDQALRPTRRAYNRYRKAGVKGVMLMEIDGMGHENPDPAELSEAIAFLDGSGENGR